MRWIAGAVLTSLARLPRATTDEIARATGLTPRQVNGRCSVLLRRGLISRRRDGRYSITQVGRELAAFDAERTGVPTGPGPKRSSLRERLWRALRMARKGTIPELLTLAATGGERCAGNNASKYLRALERAGFVVRRGEGQPGMFPAGPGTASWTLLKDSGPRAPVYSGRKRTVFDPNTGEETDLCAGGDRPEKKSRQVAL